MKILLVFYMFLVFLTVKNSFAEEVLQEIISSDDVELSVTIDNGETEEYISDQNTISNDETANENPVFTNENSEEEKYFLEKLKNCEVYESKEKRPFDEEKPTTSIIGWEQNKCLLNTVSIVGAPLKCAFTKEKLSEIVDEYASMLEKDTIDINDNAILKALADEQICSPDLPDGLGYYSDEVLSTMATNIAKCTPTYLDNVNPFTGTITQRVIKGIEYSKCVYIETYPGGLTMTCRYDLTLLPEVSASYRDMLREKAETGSVSIDSENPRLIEKLSNDSSVCEIDGLDMYAKTTEDGVE